MEKTDSSSQVRVRPDSPKQLGRRLTLRFSERILLGLDFVEFQFDRVSIPVPCVREKDFKWTKVPKAFSVLILDYFCWNKSDESFECDDEYIARSVWNACGKSGLITNLLVKKTKESAIVPYAQIILKRVLQEGTTNAKAVYFDTGFFTSDCIDIFEGKTKLGRPEVEALRSRLLQSLQRTTRPVEVRDSQDEERHSMERLNPTARQIGFIQEYRSWMPDRQTTERILNFLGKRYGVEDKLLQCGNTKFPIAILWRPTSKMNPDEVLIEKLCENKPGYKISEVEREFLVGQEEFYPHMRNGLDYRFHQISRPLQNMVLSV